MSTKKCEHKEKVPIAIFMTEENGVWLFLECHKCGMDGMYESATLIKGTYVNVDGENNHVD